MYVISLHENKCYCCESVGVNRLLLHLVQESVAIVESRKFLPLLYQLAARVSKTALESDLFQQVLQEVREGEGQNEWE